MTKVQYDYIEQWFLAHPLFLTTMKQLNRWLPRIVYCTFPLLLAVLAFERDVRFFRVLLVPAVVFLSVTGLRKCWNFPRPYEKLDIHPLIPRNKKGQSFPSRHVASVTVIAAACWYLCPPLGIAMSVIGVFIAIIRPLAGIHFPRDVIAGMLYALILAIVGFWLI